MSVKSLQPHEVVSIKQLQAKQNQFKREKAILQQKIQFLEEELKEYRQRQSDNKKINESIMITYQQNETVRDEQANRSIKILKEKHEEQIARIKQIAFRQNKCTEQSLAEFKNKYEQLLLENDRKNVQFERKVLEIKKKYEEIHKREIQEKEQQYQEKIELLKEKLKQSQGMADIYQQFVRNRRGQYILNTQGYCIEQDNERMKDRQSILRNNCEYSNKKNSSFFNKERFVQLQCQKERQKQRERSKQQQREKQRDKQRQRQRDKENGRYSRSSSRLRLKDIEQNNIRDMKRLSASRESVKQLTAKIERAVTHLKGSNNFKLHQRINQKLAKRIY